MKIQFTIAALNAIAIAEPLPTLVTDKFENTPEMLTPDNHGSYCTPINVNEMVSYNRSGECVDIVNRAGSGNVLFCDCDGGLDQQLMRCTDGTIRNQALNYCIQPENPDGTGNVVSAACTYYPKIPDHQIWDFDYQFSGADSGIWTEVYQIKNHKSHQCLNDAQRSTRNGNIDVSYCSGDTHQLFYFRSRGKSIGHGQIFNSVNNQCINQQGYGVTCDSNDATQQWVMYENGEILNSVSRLCLSAEHQDGTGQIDTQFCHSGGDTPWILTKELDYFFLRNKRNDQQCLDAGLPGWHAYSGPCNYTHYQQFQFRDGNWEQAQGRWSSVSCNQSGSLTYGITEEKTYSTEITESTTIEVSSTITEGVFFEKDELTTTISNTLSSMFSSSSSEAKEMTFTCDIDQSGRSFTSGCMYQWEQTNWNTATNSELKWKAPIIACTSGSTPPACGALYKDTAQGCQPM